jgi:hypothetical protein
MNAERSTTAFAQTGVFGPTPTLEETRPSVLRVPHPQVTRAETVAGSPSDSKPSDSNERVTFGLGALLAAGVGVAEYVSRRRPR